MLCLTHTITSTNTFMIEEEVDETMEDEKIIVEISSSNAGEEGICWSTTTTKQNQIAVDVEELIAVAAASMEMEEDNKNDEQVGECRYCHEEDFVSKLQSPCLCNGTLKYVHKTCMERWCNAKYSSIMCEICRQPLYPNYSLPDLPPQDDTDQISDEEWRIPGTNTRIRSPFVVVDGGMNRLMASMNKDFTLRNPSGGVIFGTALLIFVAVIVIKDAYTYAPPKEDKLSHTLYCALVIISVPIYILSWVIQCQAHRRERETERERERDHRTT